jgi:hypothetical protein
MNLSTAPKALAALALSVSTLGLGCSGQISQAESEGSSSAAIVARPTQLPPGVPAGFVATPVGFFHPSCLVHVNSNEAVGADATIRASTGHVRATSTCQYAHFDNAGKPSVATVLAASAAAGVNAVGEAAAAVNAVGEAGAGADTIPVIKPLTAKSDVEGWSLADYSTFNAGVSKLSTSWVVPPTPAQAGQVLFFFPGTETLDGKDGGTILQPVLAYENAQWFVQSWNCCEGGGNAEYGDSVPVSPGDTILGTNTGTNCNASTGICNNWHIETKDQRTGQASEFDTLSFGHPHQWIFGGVLEVYSLTSCDQVPTTGSLTYNNFAVSDINGNGINVPGLPWTDWVLDTLANCGNTWGGSQSGTSFTVTFGGPRGGGGSGHIVAPFSGKCLDINGAGTANGTKVQEWTCNGSAAQTFHKAAVANGNYQIVNDNSNKCVDITAAGTANGTKAQLYDCNGTGAQSFSIVDVGGGNSKLVNPNSGRCLDISASGTADGTQVQIWDCNGTGAQTWTLQGL